MHTDDQRLRISGITAQEVGRFIPKAPSELTIAMLALQLSTSVPSASSVVPLTSVLQD
jgi:hypothetical protein